MSVTGLKITVSAGLYFLIEALRENLNLFSSLFQLLQTARVLVLWSLPSSKSEMLVKSFPLWFLCFHFLLLCEKTLVILDTVGLLG